MENQMNGSFSDREKRMNTGRPVVPPNLFTDKPAAPVSKKKYIVRTGLFAVISIIILLFPCQVRVKGIGKTIPVAIQTVAAAISGKIIEVHAAEGEDVKKDSLLVKMVNEKLSLEVEETLKEKEINNVRIDKLVEENRIQEKEVMKCKVFYDVGGISRAEEVAAENKLVSILRDTAMACREKDKIEAKLQYLQSLKKKEEIRAPIDGIVLTSLKELSGKQLAEGDEVLKLGRKEYAVEVLIPEEYVRDISVGAGVTLRFSAMPLKIYRGSVTNIGSKVEEEIEKVWIKKNVVRVTIGITENNTLTPGMKAAVSIDSNKRSSIIQGIVKHLSI